MPGREDRTQNLIERCELDYVVGSVHFLGDLAVDWERFDIWESARSPEAVWRALLRDAGGGGPQRAVRHPRAPGPGEDVGLEPAGARRRPAPLLRAGARGDRRDRDRGRGLDRRAAQAGRRDLPVAGVPGRARSRRARRSRSRATRTSPSTSATPTTARSSCSTALGVRELAVFERRVRRLEPIGPMSVRTGLGYDCHRLVAGRRLVLGGVELPSERGLAGHSDADALTHAVIDARARRRGARRHRHALPRHRRALARRRLDRAAARGGRARARDAGYAIVNVDATVADGGAEARLGARADARPPRRRARRSTPERVNVKATTGEGIGFVGRGEGVAALAIATLDG